MVVVKQLSYGADIPDSDHVVRYCSPKHVDKGRIAESAFELRSNDKYFSVNWLECFEQFNDNERLKAIENSLDITVKSDGKFAQIHVGNAKQKNKDIQIKYKPTLPKNISHAGIHPPSKENLESTLLLANLFADADIFPVSSK